MTNAVLRITGVLFYCIAWFFLCRIWIGDLNIITSDALSYSSAAVHLARDGFYSLDGLQPFFEREPGYSFFLAPLYFLFGDSNLLAVFVAQGLLYLGASYLLSLEVRRQSGERIASLFFFLLLVFPGSLRAIFMLYRESFALSLCMLTACAFFVFIRAPSLKTTMLVSVLMGYLILTYFSLLFLPLFLVSLAFFLWPIPRRYLVTFFIATYLIVSLWGMRNWLQDGRFRLVDSFRTTAMWFVRAEQAEFVKGTEPFMCLWAEYISRDWTGRSRACSTNGVIHQKWPDRLLLGNEAEIAHESKVRILHHFPSYLWFSVFEVLELHLPFLGGGWPFWFHVVASLVSGITYAGLVCSLFVRHPKTHAVFLLLIIYNTLIFSLTDATPRYLMPVMFAYILFAVVGFDALFTRIKGLRKKA